VSKREQVVEGCLCLGWRAAAPSAVHLRCGGAREWEVAFDERAMGVDGRARHGRCASYGATRQRLAELPAN
jgi:hypothetical protein